MASVTTFKSSQKVRLYLTAWARSSSMTYPYLNWIAALPVDRNWRGIFFSLDLKNFVPWCLIGRAQSLRMKSSRCWSAGGDFHIAAPKIPLPLLLASSNNPPALLLYWSWGGGTIPIEAASFLPLNILFFTAWDWASPSWSTRWCSGKLMCRNYDSSLL